MLDHIFADAVGSLRQALEDVHLERTVVDERFQSDLLLGDLTWSTSYALPGETVPASVRADITLQWPSGSQTAYRQWVGGEELADPPTIVIEVVLRVQELRTPPSVAHMLAPLPDHGPKLGTSRLERDSPTVETLYRVDAGDTPDRADGDYAVGDYAFEVAYNGTCALDEQALSDGPSLDARWEPLGSWVSAALVRLGENSAAYR